MFWSLQMEHDAHLDSFLRRCQEKGLKLNAEKMEIQLNKISFMGHWITENGLHSDPEKVRAIMDMPPPTNLEELRRYLGVVNYLGKFLPNANTLHPLQNLLKKDVSWTWSNMLIILLYIKYHITAKPTAETEDYYALHQLSLMLMMKFHRPHQSEQMSPSNILILLYRLHCLHLIA